MERKYVDISELYDLFQERKDCFFVCCDIKNMTSINDISHKAGDLSILETLDRMWKSAGEEDVVFRIGGDEFCILTNSMEEEYASQIAEKIKNRNGDMFTYEAQQIPLELHVTMTRLEQRHVNYAELFAGLHHAIREGKRQ